MRRRLARLLWSIGAWCMRAASKLEPPAVVLTVDPRGAIYFEDGMTLLISADKPAAQPNRSLN